MQPITTHNNIYIPYLKVNPSYSVLYYKPESKYINTDESLKQKIMNLKKKNDGLKLSHMSKKKITNAVNWLVSLSDEKTIEINGKTIKAKITFITLTLPSKQRHTDNEIKQKCLNQLLVELKKQYSDFLYVWKAERQENGNIHFHLTTNAVLHYEELQKKWNRIISKLGYIEEYRTNQMNKHKNGFTFQRDIFEKYGISYATQKERYEKGLKTGFRQPHTTEIKRVKSIKNIASYIAKYIKKDITNTTTKIDGNLWACSELLSQISVTIDMTNEEIDFYYEKVINNEYASVFITKIEYILGTKKREEIVKQLKPILNKHSFAY